MDGFAGSKTAASEELPTATAVTDPFHVVRLAGNALDQCRRRIQDALFAGDDHVEVEATWHIYQQMIAAYHESDPTTSKTRMESLNAKLTHAVPACLIEVATLGRTPNRRRADLRFLRPPRHQQRPHQSTQRPPRTPPRLRTRLPQPHPLHRPSTPRDRRLQTSPTPSIVKSPIRFRHLADPVGFPTPRHDLLIEILAALRSRHSAGLCSRVRLSLFVTAYKSIASRRRWRCTSGGSSFT